MNEPRCDAAPTDQAAGAIRATPVLVVGAGAFGRNHLRVLREMAADGLPVQVAAVVDADASTRERLRAEFGVPAFAATGEAMEAAGAIEAAVVAVPTRWHAVVAEPLLRAGVHCLVEKPLAATLTEADALLRAADAGGAVLQPGHLERFNPAVTTAAAHTRQPMFFEAHRLSVFTPRSLDVDVVLDLMIHDLDVVLSLVDAPVREVRAVGLPVLSDRVDIANVRVEFENGCVANFTASRVSTERVRKLRFFQPRQYLSLDFARQDVLMIDVSGAGAGAAAAQRIESMEQAAAHPSPGLLMGKLPVAAGEPLRLELESFLRAARGEAKVEVTAAQGRAALALALAIDAAIAEHAQRAGLRR